MRDYLLFVLVLLGIFFGVGEWRGWYLGIPPQTPVFVYKKDYSADLKRRTVSADRLQIGVSGEVRQGNVTVAVYFERPDSFQTGRRGTPEVKVLERTFSSGQRIAFNEVIREGQGIYRLRLDFSDATGVFRVELPPGSQL